VSDQPEPEVRPDPRNAEARYRLILDSAIDYALISMDMEGKVTGWNPGARNLLGWDEAEMLGRTADIIFTPEDRQAGAADAERATADREGRAPDERWHIRKDGSRFWASGALTPMRDGQMRGYLKIMRDATAERQADERQSLLLAELQHRVRNILAVVRSLASRTVENSETLDDFASHFDGRLAALARTQSIFARTGEVAVDLDELVRDELVVLTAGSGDQVEISGPSVQLRQHAGETFALALHELATNAVKYGALAHPKGKVAVSWRVYNTSAGPRLTLEWLESGVPALDSNPKRMGFGRELIERGLPYELGAATSLSFEPGGVRALIELPLNDKTAIMKPPPPRARRRGLPADAG
jgi:two-component system CheB/CheR fusion protein